MGTFMAVLELEGRLWEAFSMTVNLSSPLVAGATVQLHIPMSNSSDST